LRFEQRSIEAIRGRIPNNAGNSRLNRGHHRRRRDDLKWRSPAYRRSRGWSYRHRVVAAHDHHAADDPVSAGLQHGNLTADVALKLRCS
jgi:hypothetical protein